MNEPKFEQLIPIKVTESGKAVSSTVKVTSVKLNNQGKEKRKSNVFKQETELQPKMEMKFNRNTPYVKSNPDIF
ncbi:MAG TPA: hypothetical protein PKE38_15855 [Ignavibacteriaceae bacterium]|nr:hypothetical protein [Ignavibacteriaceae bacterium]